jgi:hypothetical protein
VDQVKSVEAAAKDKTALEKKVKTLDKDLSEKVPNPYETAPPLGPP